DAARLHLEDGHGVVQRLLEDVLRGLPGALLDDRHRVVEDPLGDRLLPVRHQAVDELRHGLRSVDRVREYRALDGACAAAHGYFLPFPAAAPPAFGFLAPYLERLWRRSLTPAASSVPRMM